MDDEAAAPRDFFNIQIHLDDGRVYALNVWTFDFAGQLPDELRSEQDGPIYAMGHDLLVASPRRADLERVVQRLVDGGGLGDHLLVRT